MEIIGHRGARGLAPENTLVSFQKALDHHVDQIEFDVRSTSDNVAIIHHDPEITDSDGHSLSIKDTSYKQLLKHKPDMVTLTQTLEYINRKVPVCIEVKPDVNIKPVVKAVKAQIDRSYPSELLLLGSKSQKTLVELHDSLPDIKKFVIESWSGVRAHYRARQVNTNIVFMNERWLWFGFIRSVSRRGMKLYPYSLNDPAKAKRWEKYGLAGIITDYPNLFDKI